MIKQLRCVCTPMVSPKEKGLGVIVKYSLYVVLKTSPEPVFCGEFYSLKQLLQELEKWEARPDFAEAVLVKEED